MSGASSTTSNTQARLATKSSLNNHASPNSSNHGHTINATRAPVNGAHPPPSKSKKKEPAPVDPAAMYETLKNRIAALEEEEVLEEEEEKRFGEFPQHWTGYLY
jgi:hypothetical protein